MRMISKNRVLAGALVLLLSSPAVADNLYMSGAIVSGSSTAPAPIGGDLEASRTTTTGALRLGGSSSNCILDYGITTASVNTTACAAFFSSTLKSASAITAGSGTAPTSPSAGDLLGSRSTTTGALVLGGTSSSSALDYGVNHANSFTFGAPVYSSSAFYGGSAVVAGFVTAPAGPGAGDLVASRSASTGVLELGGTSTVGTFDFGVNHAAAFTVSAPLFGTSVSLSAGITATTGGFSGAVTGASYSGGAISGTTGTFSGAATSPTIAKFYSMASAQTTSPHIETFLGSINNATVALTFGLAYASAPVCVTSVNGGVGLTHIMYVSSISTSSVSVYDGAADTYYVMCSGQ
jgi:hypothetical protein